MKMAPSSDDRVDMTPVDYVAQAVVGLAQRAESSGKDVPPGQSPRGARAGRLPGDPRLRLRPARGVAGRLAHERDPLGQPFAGPVVRGLFALVDAHDAAASSSASAAGAASQPVTIACDQTLSDLQPLGVKLPRGRRRSTEEASALPGAKEARGASAAGERNSCRMSNCTKGQQRQ